MERQGIVPHQVHEEEKRKMKALLTKSKSLKSNQSEKKEAPDFFKNLKEKFVTELLDMGFDYAKVEDYLEEKGLCELRHELVVETINDPRFKNPLYTKPENEEVKFEYFNPKTHNYNNQNNSNHNSHNISLAPQGAPL